MTYAKRQFKDNRFCTVIRGDSGTGTGHLF